MHMITTEHKEKIKQLFGKHYAARIAELLERRGLTNTKGNRYSRYSISGLINNPDRQKNMDLIEAIIDIIIVEEKRQQKLIEKLNQL